MGTARAFSPVHARLAITLAFIAIVLRALFPVGYMAAPTAAGFPMTLCTGQGVMSVSGDFSEYGAAPEAHKPGEMPAGKASASGPCLFAAPAAAPAPQSQSSVPAPIARSVLAARPDAAVADAPAAPLWRPRARGPPQA